MIEAIKEGNTRKPKREDYGWHEHRGFDDESSGWMLEGGEEAYLKDLEKWKEGMPTS